MFQQIVAIIRYGKKEVVHSVTTEVFLRQVPLAVKVVVVKTAFLHLILVCSSNSISAQDIIQLYAGRFSIETAIEQIKGLLGWEDYQCNIQLAFHQFVNFVCFAGSRWNTINLCIPVLSWIEGLFSNPYIIQTETDFGLIRQVIRQCGLQKLVFSKLAQQSNLRKNIRLHYCL